MWYLFLPTSVESKLFLFTILLSSICYIYNIIQLSLPIKVIESVMCHHNILYALCNNHLSLPFNSCWKDLRRHKKTSASEIKTRWRIKSFIVVPVCYLLQVAAVKKVDAIITQMLTNRNTQCFKLEKKKSYHIQQIKHATTF